MAAESISLIIGKPRPCVIMPELYCVLLFGQVTFGPGELKQLSVLLTCGPNIRSWLLVSRSVAPLNGNLTVDGNIGFGTESCCKLIQGYRLSFVDGGTDLKSPRHCAQNFILRGPFGAWVEADSNDSPRDYPESRVATPGTPRCVCAIKDIFCREKLTCKYTSAPRCQLVWCKKWMGCGSFQHSASNGPVNATFEALGVLLLCNARSCFATRSPASGLPQSREMSRPGLFQTSMELASNPMSRR